MLNYCLIIKAGVNSQALISYWFIFPDRAKNDTMIFRVKKKYKPEVLL